MKLILPALANVRTLNRVCVGDVFTLNSRPFMRISAINRTGITRNYIDLLLSKVVELDDGTAAVKVFTDAELVFGDPK